MNERISAKAIAEILGVTKRAVLVRANGESWNFKEAQNTSGGGSQRLFDVNSLPDDIKSKIIQHQHNCCSDLIPQNKIDFDEIEGSLEKWSRASKKHQFRASARSEIIKAIETFCEIKGFNQTNGENVFALLYRERQAPGIGDEVYKVEKRISVASIRRWRKAYKQSGLAGLLPNYSSNKDQFKAVTPEIRIFIIAHIKQTPHIRSSHLFKLVTKTFKSGPSRRTVYRFVDKWKTDNPALWAMLEDPQRWKNNFMPAAGNASAGIDYFCHTWEMDSTPADIITADGKRCSIIGSIDVFSRRAKLLVAPTSKSLAIAACMRMCFMSWGIAHSIRKDNGKDYSSSHIEAIVTALEIETPPLPKYASEKKPFIERFFGTFSMGLEELSPGYCGHSVAERQAIRSRQTWAAKIMDPGATIEVPLTLKEFQALCDKWIEIYENSPHTSLDGKTPYQKFKESTYFPQKIRDERVLDLLLAPVINQRRVLKKGISIDGQYYWADELMDYIGKYVSCRRDLESAGIVYVFNTTKDKDFICKATNEPLIGQRLEDYQVAKKQNLKKLRDKTKALDSLALGSRNALQILTEDAVANEKEDNLIPFQLEADNSAIREAKKVVSDETEPTSLDLPSISPNQKTSKQDSINPVYDDYRTDEDLDRDLDEMIKEAAAKKDLGFKVGKPW